MNSYLIGILISIFFYAVFSIFIGKKVKNANDYFVAGRNAPLLLVVGSVVASSISTGLFMGEAGQAYIGMFALLVIVWRISGAGYTYGAIFFGRYLRRSNVSTLPQFFSRRYNSERLYKLSTITAIVTMFVYMLSTMQGIASLIQQVTGLSYEISLVLVFSIITLMTLLAGSKGVLLTDTIMFSLFTIVMFLGLYFVSNRLGGWFSGIDIVKQNTELPNMLSWSGSPGVYKGTITKNIIWAISNGIVWFSVPYVSPWQTSRYLMARDEHTVIRASVWVSLFSFVSMLTVMMTAVFVRQINPNIDPASNVLIWSAMNVMPKFIGVLLLTGIVAAGISSATTFLSMMSSSFSLDVFNNKDDSKQIKIGKFSALAISLLMFVLAYYRPPQIWVIMYIGATIIACSWLPISIAAVWIPKVNGSGAFWGMLLGFCGSFITDLVINIFSIDVPFWFNSFYVGILLAIIGIIFGTLFGKENADERARYEELHIMPDSELNDKEMKKTKIYSYLHIVLSFVITAILLIFWAIPVAK